VLAAVAALELLLVAGAPRGRLLRALALLPAPLIALAIVLPIQLRHASAGHGLFPTGYDSKYRTSAALQPRWQLVPYHLRRPPVWFYGLDGEVLRRPYFPTSAAGPGARFWPVLHASTFCDYYGYRFAGEKRGPEAARVGGKPVAAGTVGFMRLAVAAGIPLALAVAAAWFASTVALLRRRDLARLALLLAPAAAVAGQMHFAVKFNFDEWGPVKGLYLQFAAAPLCALLGVAVAWLWDRRRLRPLAVALLLALAAVGAYVLHALQLA
jgi:hypothetical protein